MKLQPETQLRKTGYELITEELMGYWTNDIWDVRECPLFTTETKCSNPLINMGIIAKTALRNEFKYYFFKRLSRLEISLRYVWENANRLKNLIRFIDKFYPNLSSIIDVPSDKFRLLYRTYLKQSGVRSVKDNLQLYNQIHLFISDLYDDRDELDKDIWDVRKLGIDYNQSRGGYKLNFTSVTAPFRPLVKRYIRIRLLSQESMTFSTAMQYIVHLQVFFRYIHKKHPEWINLKLLSRTDIEDFLQYVRSVPMGGNNPSKSSKPTNNHINRVLICLSTFLSHVQIYEWEEAPTKSTALLIFLEDIPKSNNKNVDHIKNRIKYIPDSIWEQVMQHINKLPRKIIPIVLLLEATGFRISDIVALKVDCLLQKEDGYWLIGDQRKVKEKQHRVPISTEIAQVVMAQQQITRERSTPSTNPSNYLFPMYRGVRIGKPIDVRTVARSLNRLAVKFNIVDESGQIYKFRAHGFRHRYGINLINNGMDIIHVQKLMAHASPEMTLAYAKIHDTTLRKAWEKAQSNGAVRLDRSGKIVTSDLDQQAHENGLELEWIRHNLDSIRLDHGFCIKSPKQRCDFLEQVLEPPCIKHNCKSFHVDATFLSYYNDQIDKMESDLRVYAQSNRTRSIELIQPKLNKYKDIREAIIKNGGVFGQPKQKREYAKEERADGK